MQRFEKIFYQRLPHNLHPFRCGIAGTVSWSVQEGEIIAWTMSNGLITEDWDDVSEIDDIILSTPLVEQQARRERK